MASKRTHRVSKVRSTAKKLVKKKAPAKLKVVGGSEAVPAKKAAAPAKKSIASVVSKTAIESKTKKEKSGKGGISDRLLAAIERRRKEGTTPGTLFAKPARRRGRRPKNTEYNPDGSPEEAPEEADTHLAYDTGIQVSYAVDGDVPSFERSDDYDKELDFDH